MAKKKKLRVPAEEETPIASMIDVVFLLLCFFITTSNPPQDEAHISIILPAPSKTPPSEKTEPPPSVDIYILGEVQNTDANGKFSYQMNGGRYTSDRMDSSIRKIAADPEQAQEVLVNVKVKLDAKHKRVIELVDILKKNHIEKINILSLK